MKLNFLIIFTILFSLSAFSQNDFERGYFIKNDGNKIACLIQPLDWGRKPVTFRYRFSENTNTEVGKIENIKEFGIGNSTKYIRATVNIDQSSDAVANLTYDRNPNFIEETIFLQVLVEGRASLFFTSQNTRNKYFIRLNSNEIEQLIYKRYLISPSKIGKNERYKQQLATSLVCKKLREKDFENLQYKFKNLTHIFEVYNSCIQSDYTSFQEIKEEKIKQEKDIHKGKLNLSLRPGVTFSSYYINTDIQKENFDNKIGYRIGLELEYFFPSKKRKWAIFMEPSYRNYESQRTVKYVDFFSIQKSTTITVKKNSIDILTGPRYYFHLGEKSSIFIDASLLVDTNINSEIISSNEESFNKSDSIELGNSFGLGYRYNEKLSLQFRYNNYLSNFNSTSIVLGYNFL
jgi:hypothetical protein